MHFDVSSITGIIKKNIIINLAYLACLLEIGYSVALSTHYVLGTSCTVWRKDENVIQIKIFWPSYVILYKS